VSFLSLPLALLKQLDLGTYSLVWYVSLNLKVETYRFYFFFLSSATDQFTGLPVAIKKVTKPFSTPTLSKRAYRELKLLKHLHHDNVRSIATCLLYI
jgi:serine/threonine protein kinase